MFITECIRAKSLIRAAFVAAIRACLSATTSRYVESAGEALVFAPHQDDETLGCGAMIARKRMTGVSVHVIFLTDGSASHPKHPINDPAAIAAIRKREALAALCILGVETSHIHFLDARDGSLGALGNDQRRQLVGKISARINSIQPREIFLPCSPDASSEHDASFAFVFEALRQTDLRPDIWQYPVWAWWNPVILLDRIFHSHARCCLPAEDYFVLKKMALACYRSQTEPLPPDLAPALPPGFLGLFLTKVEYFFRHNYPGEDPRVVCGRNAVI